MSLIQVLDEATINQIAAGEVVERPSAIVKELIENAMDAGATAVTAEIKEGGLSFIRITDNGGGIAREDIPLAFLRHATSKIRKAEDLLTVTSLGFRGEALSSIAAVAQVELITKTPAALNGYRYIIEGGEEKSLEEIGCPTGTTIIVRNIFYNTPARRKFLKSAMTEAGYISDLMERLMVSHPGVSFKFIMNNQVKLQSSGNNNCKDILYHVYGRDISKELLPVEYASEDIKISGYIGKPLINRGNRNFENYYINGRYIKSNIITKAIEEAYKPFLMQHKYPFTSIYFEINPTLIDVNVHPQKLEIRLKNGEDIYQLTHDAIRNSLIGKEMIPKVALVKEEHQKEYKPSMPEPFEINRRKQFDAAGFIPGKAEPIPYVASDRRPHPAYIPANSHNFSQEQSANNSANHKEAYASNSEYVFRNEPGRVTEADKAAVSVAEALNTPDKVAEAHNTPDKVAEADVLSVKVAESDNIYEVNKALQNTSSYPVTNEYQSITPKHDHKVSVQKQGSEMSILNQDKVSIEQLNLFGSSDNTTSIPFLSKQALEEHRIIGQLFSTYWLVEYKKELFIIDQHAAHEKVLYERIMTAAKTKTFVSQQLLPPIVLTLTLREQEILQKQEEVLRSLGYEFEHFGGKEYSVRAVPADLFGISDKELLLEFLDELAEDYGSNKNTASMLEKAASLSCKAAVKANHTFSTEEATALIKELLTLQNPYHCPHGRPVIISMSQYELERKFKRIL